MIKKTAKNNFKFYQLAFFEDSALSCRLQKLLRSVIFYSRHTFSVFQLLKVNLLFLFFRVSIRAGTNFNDLQEVEVVDLHEPTEWVVIPTIDIRERPIRTFMIQIAVISNHQNGRDTHMRQIKVHSPVDNRSLLANDIGNFVTVQCQQYATLR